MSMAVDPAELRTETQNARDPIVVALDDVIADYHGALDQFVNGNPGPLHALFSSCADVSLANPVAPIARGWEQVVRTQEHASSQFHESGPIHFTRVVTHVTAELAFIVETERWTGKAGVMQESAPFALRVTTIFRPEEGRWKVLHRHADALTASRPVESIAQV